MVTAPITADQVLKVAQGQEGVREEPPGSNHVLYAEWFGLDRNPWCAMFVSWVLHTAGWAGFAISTSKGYASVYSGVTWFKKQNAWAGPDVVPKPGWIVFYGFGDGHTGLVKSARSVSDITAIEGNTDEAGGSSGGKVMEKHRSATNSADHILGYGVIAYQPATIQEDDDMPKMTLYAPDAGDDHGKLFLVGTASYEHVIDGHTETDELQRQWGQPVPINAVAWDHLKTGLKKVGSA